MTTIMFLIAAFFSSFVAIKIWIELYVTNRAIELIVKYRFIWLWKNDGLGYPDIDVDSLIPVSLLNLSIWRVKDVFKCEDDYLKVKGMTNLYWDSFLIWVNDEDALLKMAKWSEIV